MEDREGRRIQDSGTWTEDGIVRDYFSVPLFCRLAHPAVDNCQEVPVAPMVRSQVHECGPGVRVLALHDCVTGITGVRDWKE